MVNTIPLRLNKDFRRLYGRGQSLVSPVVVIYVSRNNKGYNRLGITVSKKSGGAVVRNRARRIIKEAYRHLEPSIIKGYDFVLVARVKTSKCKTNDIEKALKRLLEEKKLLNL